MKTFEEFLSESAVGYIESKDLTPEVKKVVDAVGKTLLKFRARGRISAQMRGDGSCAVNVELGDHVENDALVDALNDLTPHKWKYGPGDIKVEPCGSIYPSPKYRL